MTASNESGDTIVTQADLPGDPLEPVSQAEAWVTRTYETGSVWFAQHWLEVALAIVVAFIIYALLSVVCRTAAARARRREPEIDVTTIVLRVIGRTSRFFRLMTAIIMVADYTPMPAGLYRLFAFLFTVAAAWQAAVWLRELILGWVERRTFTHNEPNETLQNAMTLIRLLVNFAVFSVAIIVILDNLGVDVTGLVAGLGIGGIAIGLAAQGIFSDLFAALSIIFDKPFKRGQVINFDTTFATVEKIGLKSTRLRAIDGQEVIVSNTDLLSKRIENLTRMERRRIYHQIGVIYQTPVAKLRALPDRLAEIVERNDGVMIRAGLIGFGASSIDFELVYDSMSGDYMEMFNRRQAVALDIVELFETEGYEFAYPTQTTFTAAPDGEMVLPYPQVQAFKNIEEGGN